MRSDILQPKIAPITGQPVTVNGWHLEAAHKQIQGAGFEVTKMKVQGSSYTLHLSRQPKARP